jgi:hypothetical protein
MNYRNNNSCFQIASIDSINTKKYRSNNFCIVFFEQSLQAQVNHTGQTILVLGQNLKNQKSGEY